MNDATQFCVEPRPPARPRDWWLLTEDGGAIHVLHRWSYPETAGPPFSGAGQSRLSLAEFFRSEASDTAKRRLRGLLSEKGHSFA